MTEFLTCDANPLEPEAETDSLAFVDGPLPRYDASDGQVGPMFTEDEIARLGCDIDDR